jgi:hypothetical protein
MAALLKFNQRTQNPRTSYFLPSKRDGLYLKFFLVAPEKNAKVYLEIMIFSITVSVSVESL